MFCGFNSKVPGLVCCRQPNRFRFKCFKTKENRRKRKQLHIGFLCNHTLKKLQKKLLELKRIQL